MDLLKFLPHAIFSGLSALFLYVLRGYARRLDRMIDNGATKKDVREVELRMDQKLSASEERYDTSLADLRSDQRQRDDRLEKRIDDGFRGLSDRIDKLIDRAKVR